MSTTALAQLSLQQLQRAIAIKEKMEALEHELSAILGTPVPAAPAGRGRRRPKISAAGKARIAAAQRARWAKLKGKASAKSAKPVVKRRFSAQARARLAAAAKARWAKVKAAGHTSLAG